MIFLETETSELKRVLNDTLPKEIDAFLVSFNEMKRNCRE